MDNRKFQRLVLQCLRAVRNSGACNSEPFERGYYELATAIEMEDEAKSKAKRAPRKRSR